MRTRKSPRKRAKERGDEMVDECKQEAQATKSIGEKPVMKVTIAGHTAKDVKRLVDEGRGREEARVMAGLRGVRV